MSATAEDPIVSDSTSEDRRNSCRMPQAGGLGTAELRVGKKMVEVELLDESAGGFLVAGEAIPETSPTHPVDLTTISGQHRVQVVWRRTAEGRTRLGLQRLLDELKCEDRPSWVIWIVLAITLGLGLGYVIAFGNGDDLAAHLRERITGRP